MTRTIARSFAMVLVLSAAILLRPTGAPCAEAILSWQSDISVLADGGLLVDETIEVVAEGERIRRGIYRDFPTEYRDADGRRVRVGFEVRSLTRDGETETHHQEKRSNGIRIYFGSEDRLLPHGIHTYVFSYRTDGQLGYFEDHDELYWNVTGNGWAFPIEAATAVVTLPGGAAAENRRLTAYTGAEGSREQAATWESAEDGRALFSSRRVLGPGEGLTVVVGWPKGLVAQPTGRHGSRTAFLVGREHLILWVGALAVLGYYMTVWARVGKDPARGTVIPLFEPPSTLSPAEARFIRKMGFDDRTFAAAVLNMAVKGYLTVREERGLLGLGRTFTLERTGTQALAPLSDGEAALGAQLFPSGVGSIRLEQANHDRVGGAIKALKRSLDAVHDVKTFRGNAGYLWLGIGLSIFTVVVTLLWAGAWEQGVNSSLSLWYVPPLVLMAGSAAIFSRLLKAPSRAGRRLMDAVEGFRMYLATAEGPRLQKSPPPEKTPELFERYLPYALALDVEQDWAEGFSAVLARSAEPERGYSPRWYRGGSFDPAHAGSFASGLGSALSSAISSSSTPPGSKSGFSGGGHSGGGGGGGGGGGW